MSVVLLAVGVGLTVLATILLRQDIARGQAARLADNARATTNIFSTVTQSVSALLTTGGVVADSTGGSAAAFTRAVGSRLAPTLLSNAVLFDVSRGAIRQRAWVGQAKQCSSPASRARTASCCCGRPARAWRWSSPTGSRAWCPTTS